MFEYADRYGFVIASDECYSEIYPDEARPPLGALEAAHRLGRDFRNLVVFTSLSKRSNAPGLRSGGVAGDPALLARGMTVREAAAQLGLTEHTVAGYIKVLYQKLNISTRAQAALEAVRRKLV